MNKKETDTLIFNLFFQITGKQVTPFLGRKTKKQHKKLIDITGPVF